jgi:ribosomal 50S subunit-recycling heat shock protein
MRLDKYLKTARLIKRRTVANEACGTERVEVNGKTAKSSYRVKVGDIITISFGTKILKRITALQTERRSNKKYEKNNKFYSRS